jgi:anthranilate phosphoribosyltransferase
VRAEGTRNPRQVRRLTILGAVPNSHKAGYNRHRPPTRMPSSGSQLLDPVRTRLVKPFQARTVPVITSALGRLAAGQDLTLDEMTDVIDQVMSGSVPAGEIAVLLTALRAKGESVDEIAGAALAMRRYMTPIRTVRTNLVDTCGTGGIGSDLFNISTTAAIVTAAAGVPVAKHGNRSITSRSGSADVLAALGIHVEAEVPAVERCLDELGICFCFAPRLHPAMKHVAAVRKQLGIPTIFNLLGPLCNPAGAARQLMGVGRRELHPTMAAVLARLGTERAVVVHGTDGLGEVSLGAATEVIEIVGNQLCEFSWKAADFGLAPAGLDTLRVAGPEESATIVQRVLAGEAGPPRDIVILNAAAALWTAEPRLEEGATPQACAARAAAAIDSGAARELLARWQALSHSR